MEYINKAHELLATRLNCQMIYGSNQIVTIVGGNIKMGQGIVIEFESDKTMVTLRFEEFKYLADLPHAQRNTQGRH